MFCTYLLVLDATAQVNSPGATAPAPPAPAETESPADTSGSATLDSLLPPDIAALLSQGRVVRAYLLTEWAADTTAAGLLGFRIERQTDSLPPAPTDEIRKLLTDPGTYDGSPAAKRCLFSPRLGLDIRHGNERSIILVATNCDVLKVLTPDGKVRFTEDVDAAHDGFAALARALFPDTSQNRRNS